MKVFLGILGSLVYLVIFYYIIKVSVKDAIIEASKVIEKNKHI